MEQRNIEQEYKDLINKNKVFLFMKGTADEPRCGFSFRVCNILKSLGIEFKTYNILEDIQMREGVKEFANWPTYPQLYINSEFVGGCEVVEELARNGELKKLL